MTWVDILIAVIITAIVTSNVVVVVIGLAVAHGNNSREEEAYRQWFEDGKKVQGKQ